jgi:predicted RNase H-like nuclease (RuvC/YqgF family)
MTLALIGVIMLVALMIPIFGIVVDSPIGRAIARRMEGPEAAVPPGISELTKKVEVLETEVDDLSRAVESLREENQFLQRLLEESPGRPALPPRQSP